MTPARIVSAVLALVVAAWFALGIRQAHDTSAATAIIAGHRTLSARQAQRADSLLRAAGTLNPDSQVDLLRGQVAIERNDPARAVRISQDVVRREPMNIRGWAQLAGAAQDNHSVLAEAARQVLRLAPRGARPHQ